MLGFPDKPSSEERRQRLAINNFSRCDDRPGGRVAVSDGVPGEGPKGGARMYDKIQLSGIVV